VYYDNEANLISWEITGGKIDHAREFGNFIIHFSSAGKPILVEILDASKFVGQLDKIKIKSIENVEKIIPAS